MTNLKTLALGLASALVFALPASANNTGLAVHATLALGPGGNLGGQAWAPQDTTIGNRTEYEFATISTYISADFTPNQLHILDQVLRGPGGWEMTFATPGGFTGISLLSSTFGLGLTYGLHSGTIVIDWTGDLAAPPRTHGAVFAVTAAVPEPATYGMMFAGLGMLGWAARRKAAQRE